MNIVPGVRNDASFMALFRPRHPWQLRPMSASGSSWYDERAADAVPVYEAADPAALHAWLDGLLPTSPGLVADIGAGSGSGSGSGRDAAWFASLGHKVLAVEPSASMRDHGTRLHDDARIRWVTDGLPSLAATLRLGLAADVVHLGAVWQHVSPADRPRAFRELVGLLRSGGVLAVTLRHGLDDGNLLVRGSGRHRRWYGQRPATRGTPGRQVWGERRSPHRHAGRRADGCRRPGRRAGMAPRPRCCGRTAKDASFAGRDMALREAVVPHGPRSTGLVAS